MTFAIAAACYTSFFAVLFFAAHNIFRMMERVAEMTHPGYARRFTSPLMLRGWRVMTGIGVVLGLILTIAAFAALLR